MNLYLQVFTEAAHTASIIPMASEAALAAMRSFGGYNLPLAVTLATAGAILGQIFNLYLGTWIRKLPASEKGMLSEAHYEKIKALFHKYGIWLLLFCWVPIFNFLVVVAGFFQVRLKTALPLIAAGLVVHYGMMLL